MKSKLFTLLAVMSLVLGLLAILIGVRSYFVEYSVYRGTWSLHSDRGAWIAWRCLEADSRLEFYSNSTDDLTAGSLLRDNSGGSRFDFDFAGFASMHFTQGSLPTHHWVMFCPQWLPIVPLLFSPTVCGLTRWRGRSRGHAGRCAACGYDLRRHAGTLSGVRDYASTGT